MSGRKKGKVSTPRTERSPEELEAAFARALRTLSDAADRFDAGSRDEAFLMAGVMRSLLHFGQGKPLLQHMGVIKKLQYVDASPQKLDLPGHVQTFAVGGGLTRLKLGHDSAELEPLLGGDDGRVRQWGPWWKSDLVVRAGDDGWYSRSFLVLQMANTDFAHFDPFLDPDYAKLTTDTAGWQSGYAGVVTGDVATASVRTITWELLSTFDRAGLTSGVRLGLRRQRADQGVELGQASGPELNTE